MLRDMIRCVLDSNIYISALVFGGTPRLLLERAEAGEFQVFVSAPIQSEVERILLYKFAWGRREVAFACEKVWRPCRVVTPKTPVAVADDPEDDRVLECALEARADFIVSGDNDLLRLRVFEAIPILKARAFLAKIEPPE